MYRMVHAYTTLRPAEGLDISQSVGTVYERRQQRLYPTPDNNHHTKHTRIVVGCSEVTGLLYVEVANYSR